MTFKGVFDAAIAALNADSYIVAKGIKVLPGIQANMTIDDLAQRFEATFSAGKVVVVVEHPESAAQSDARGRLLVLDTMLVIKVVENPAQREASGSIDPLEFPWEIMRALYGKPTSSAGLAENFFTPAAKAYEYVGDARGFLFHAIRFTIRTELIPRTLPARPVPRNV